MALKHWLLLGFVLVGYTFANDCRYYRTCGKYAREPYQVSYSFPTEEYWGYEKHFQDNGVVVKARELEPGEQYRHPLPPIDQSIQFRLNDLFPYSKKIYTYRTTVEDEQGREHFLTLQWSSHFNTQDRTFALLKRRKFYHFVKVTLNDKLLFLVDDRVDRGAYDYEDFFRVGNRKYRMVVTMQGHHDAYYMGATLVNTYWQV